MTKSSRDYPRNNVALMRNPVFKWIWKRVRWHNNNCIIYVLGQPGAGKSYTALSMAYDLDRDIHGESRFSLDQVAFTAKEFHSKIQEYKTAGNCIVWDEAGVLEGANARKHWSKANMTISSLFQIIRKNRQIVFVTLPVLKFLDAQARMVGHMLVSLKGHTDSFAYGKVKLMSLNPEANRNNLYYVYPRDAEKVYRKFKIPAPPKDLADDYEELHSRVKDKWIGKWEEDILQDEKESKKWDMAEKIEAVKKHSDKFWDFEEQKPNLLNLKTVTVPGYGRTLPRSQAKTIEKRLNADFDAGDYDPGKKEAVAVT